jgi:transglutaminase-like putative cysteine protease
VLQTLQKLRAGMGKNGDLMLCLFEHCKTEIEPGDATLPQDAAAVLQRGTATSLGRVRALVALCRAAKLPARLVTGFEVKEILQTQPHTWMEVYSGKA